MEPRAATPIRTRTNNFLTLDKAACFTSATVRGIRQRRGRGTRVTQSELMNLRALGQTSFIHARP